MRGLALQSAVGERLRSILGVVLAAACLLPRVEGTIAQEAIDICAALTALRVLLPDVTLTDTVGPMW
jgi:hypothetical protein